MITILKERIVDPLQRVVRLIGLSTDSKPTEYSNASEFYEMDTDVTYIYSADDSEWKAQPRESGGGGGGITPVGTKQITANGNYNVFNYAYANVNVPTVEPTGNIDITSNGNYNVKNYATANVSVPQPSGSLSITENGTFDVTAYAQALVNVAGGGGKYDITVTSGTFVLASDTSTVSIPYDIEAKGHLMLGFFSRTDSEIMPSTTFSTWSFAAPSFPEFEEAPSFCTFLRTVTTTSQSISGKSEASVVYDSASNSARIASDAGNRPWAGGYTYGYVFVGIKEA